MKVALTAGLAHVVGALIAIFLFTEHDRAANYEETIATVRSVEPLCSFEIIDQDLAMDEKWEKRKGPCGLLKRLYGKGHVSRGYELVEIGTFVKYDYASPADGQWYSASLLQYSEEDPTPMRPGDELVVLAHKEVPGKTRTN